MKSNRILLPLVIFIAIFLLLWRGLSLHPNQVPSPLIGKPAPSNQDFIGKVTLVNVWASWCATCVEEHEVLMKLAKTEHIDLYGLNYKDDLTAAKAWLKQHGNPYSRIVYDKEGTIAIDWGVYGTPETFIIDKQGIIRYKYIGAITWDVWVNELKPVIEKLK